MILFRPILVALIAFAVASYAADCSPLVTPDEAMQCCDSMPCASHSPEHSQDCCKTMPSLHAPFVQAPSAQGLSFSLVVLALPVSGEATCTDSSAHVIATNCHAPHPPDVANSSPLRL
jgi:hypothetical protein